MLLRSLTHLNVGIPCQNWIGTFTFISLHFLLTYPKTNLSIVITQREMVSRLIRENLSRRAARFNLVLDDVSLTHVGFSPAFSEAVESKQIAQQTAQRAAFLVDQAIQEKQSIIVRAQGEAKSAELIGDAIKQNKGFLTLRKLEAAREIAQLVSGSGNRVMLDSDSLLLNVNAADSDGEKSNAAAGKGGKFLSR